MSGKFERSRSIRKLRLTSSDRRTQILAAAMQLFSDRGFHATRTRELAEKAGVSEALLFRHFPTKEALIRAILELVGLEGRLREMEQKLESVPPREGLRMIAEQVLTSLHDQPETFRVVFFGIMETPKLASEFYQKFLSRLLALETRLFQRAFTTARVPASRIDPAVVARSFHGSLLFYNLAGAIIRIEPLPRDPKALAEAIVNLYLPEESS